MMAKLLLGTLTLAIAIALTVGVAYRRGVRLRDLSRLDGDRILAAAKGLALVLIVGALALLVLLNNR